MVPGFGPLRPENLGQIVRGTIVVTTISRIVVFKMVDDTTIEVNEPSCPSEVGHPIIISHGSNPFVRKFKFSGSNLQQSLVHTNA